MHVLQLELKQSLPLAITRLPTIELFCDARGHPGHVAAVLANDSGIMYTDWAPPSEVLATFHNRNDNQIMGLEILAVVLGLCTFRDKLSGHLVRVWEDNAGAEGSIATGGSKASDHNLLVHAIWFMAAKYGFGLWVERVCSEDNIADNPSREDHNLLRQLGAIWCPPYLPVELWQPTAWAAYDKLPL